MEKELPKRKHPRLDYYDYSSQGAYFITICTQNRRNILSEIVGQGLAPTEENDVFVKCTKYGEICTEQLYAIETRYEHVKIDKFVIMPNHIHFITNLEEKAAGASPRPTVMDVICSYKSLVAKKCRENGFNGKLFQTSFYEHIIRDRNDYNEIVRYIHENPINWKKDDLYIE